jgi:hypothetical protein
MKEKLGANVPGFAILRVKHLTSHKDAEQRRVNAHDLPTPRNLGN